MYLGMKVDLKGSHKIIERGKVQDQFFDVTNKINIHYRDYLAAKMIITHGDEA
jgi:hypothetical protein